MALRSLAESLRMSSLAVKHFWRRSKPIWQGCRRWRRLNSKLSASKKHDGSPPTFNISIRYDFVGTHAKVGREERVGKWQTRWSRDQQGAWRILKWEVDEEIVSRARGPMFIDVTSQAVGNTDSYKNQMLHGVDHWRTVMDGACGIDVYGNNGVGDGRHRQ